MPTIELIQPALRRLPSYVEALKRGWSPDNLRLEAAASEQLERIAADSAGFIASLDDPEAKGGPVPLLDGSLVPRLPGLIRWMWDGAFCGSIGLRWQKGTTALPAHVLGHIGFSVVPWKRNRGCAKAGLRLILLEAAARGLPFVELTVAVGNGASRAVIEACGGQFVERFEKPASLGGTESLRFRIALSSMAVSGEGGRSTAASSS